MLNRLKLGSPLLLTVYSIGSHKKIFTFLVGKQQGKNDKICNLQAGGDL